MNTRLEKLFFTIEAVDKASGVIDKIMGKIDLVQQKIKQGFGDIVAGGAGLLGVGYSLEGMMAPTIAIQEALGEVASLGVSDDALERLSSTALTYSIRFGDSAAEFVSASYDIQSAINGLSALELSAFTQSSAVLAMATKSDTATITDYLGTMYGIFSDSALQMGNTNWVENLAGQTASAVQMFKTTGSKMAAAFSSLGAGATASGIAMSEQMAILGTLQATMSGSEAGTRYTAFLSGVGKAQQALGLSFTDSYGRMLPMVDILERLRGKFGDIDTVAEADMLEKAFGTKDAVKLIQLLMKDTAGLAKNIDKLAHVRGMEKATLMAEKQIDPWERVSAAITAVSIVFGTAMMPAIEPVLDKMSQGGETVMRWTQLFPHLTKVVGFSVLAFFGLIAALSLFSIVSGIANMVMAASTIVTGAFTLAWGAATAIVGVFTTVLKAARVAVLLFNLSLYANPIVWIVGSLGALVAGVVLAVKHWDSIKAAFADFNVFEALGNMIDWLIEKINLIPGINIDVNRQINTTDDTGARIEKERQQLRHAVPSLNTASVDSAQGPGLLQNITRQIQSNNNATHIENLTIQPQGEFNANRFADELALST